MPKNPNVSFLNGPNSFCLCLLFLNTMTNIVQNLTIHGKSVDGVLGI